MAMWLLCSADATNGKEEKKTKTKQQPQNKKHAAVVKILHLVLK